MIQFASITNYCTDCLDPVINSSSPGGSLAHTAALDMKTRAVTRTCEVIEQPDALIAKAKRCLFCLPKAISVVFRICTTVLSVGTFAGYYVSVVSVTAVSALTGMFAGLMIKTTGLAAGWSTRSVSEYALVCARATFGWLSMLYEQVSCTLKGALLPAIAAAMLFLLETATIPIKRIPLTVYETVCNAVHQATRPYQAITDLTARLFETTKKVILA